MAKKKRDPVRKALVQKFSKDLFPPRQRFLGLERKRFEQILSDFYDEIRDEIIKGLGG